jgi:hypothetical protein
MLLLFKQELQRAAAAVGVELRRLVLLAEQRGVSITGTTAS